MTQVRCFYCGHEHEEIPLHHECPGCTVDLNYLIEPGDTRTVGDLIERFKAKYGFDPAEMFPRFRDADPTVYADQSLLGHILRPARQDIEAAEDARTLKMIDAMQR